MSNNDNIYNILNNFNKIAKDQPAPAPAPVKVKTKLQESMEQVVNEKYMGFKKTVAAIKKGGSAEDPEAVAAAIGRKKYGKEKFQKAAAAGKKLGEGQGIAEEQQDESALQYYTGVQKHGEKYMKAAAAAGREGASQEELGALKDKLSKAHKGKIKNEDHGPENPDAPVNYGEYDREGDMAKDDLYTIDSAAEELYSILQADDNLPEWVQSKITKAVDYLDTARDYMKAQSYGQGMAEGFDDMIKDVNRKAKEKGTGKFDKKEISTGTVYTRKYNPKSGETDDTENVSTEKRGRGRPKKSAFEDMSTIDKMIAESFGELFEGTSRPINDPVSKAAPTAPAVGSGIRVAPMPVLATPAKPKAGMGTIKGGVFTADPPKPGEQGVPVPQGLDEVDAEMEGMRKLAGLKGNDGNLANNAKPYDKVTRRDVIQGAQGKDEMGGKEHDLEEGGRDDYDEIRDKIQWLQGAPNYLSRDEAKETAYYTKDTDPVWDGYRDDDEITERVTIGPDGKVTGGFQPSTAPDTPEQAARRQQSLQAYQAQQQAQNKPPSFASDVDSAKKGLYMKPGDNTVYSGTRGPGPSMAANRLEKQGVDIPGLVGNRVNPDNIVDEVDDMEEGNAFSKAVVDAKKDGVQPGEKIQVGDKEYDLKEGDDALNQMRRIAGLKEGGMSPISGMASDMEKQQGSMNISTNQSSDGTKSVTITAAGDAASDLMQMLKLAGMGGGGATPVAEPEIVLVAQDSEEAMEEEKDPRYQASTTPDEQVAPVQALTKGGNGDVAGQEKTMKPGGYQFGDNNLAMQESLNTQLMKEYNSIKVKK